MSLNASYWVQLYFSISPWKSCCTRRLWRERGRWLWLKDQRAVQSQRICRLQDKGATWGKDKVGRMLLLSFHSEMITQGQIVNALLYCSFLRHQRETFVFSSRMKLMLKGGHIAMLVEIKHTADARAINQRKTGEDAQASIFVEDKQARVPASSTLPPPCLIDGVVFFGSRAVSLLRSFCCNFMLVSSAQTAFSD